MVSRGKQRLYLRVGLAASIVALLFLSDRRHANSATLQAPTIQNRPACTSLNSGLVRGLGSLQGSKSLPSPLLHSGFNGGISTQRPFLSSRTEARMGITGRISRPVVYELSDKGRRIVYSPGKIKVGRVLGEGSYGVVYQGVWCTPEGDKQVVLKRVKYNVEDADTMAHYEHLFNAYLSKAAKDSIAAFIGYFDVTKQEDPSIPPGKWLVWKYEGDKTLSYYLARRDCEEALGQELGVSMASVVPTVLKQVLSSVQKLHQAGIIHRDIKPSNIIFVDDSKQLKLIDLGACADLRRGTNYVPDESILDPLYCPPEDFVLPTTTPNLSKQSAVVSMAMSPLLWSRHLPDRFDTYSVGIILMQLALPALRSDQGLRNFNMALKRARYDLKIWRKTQRGIPDSEFAVLDMEGGMGFDLASRLLTERGSTRGFFGSLRRSKARISTEEALNHPFCVKLANMQPTAQEQATYEKRKAEKTAATKSGSGKKRGLFWRLFDLEARLNIKASATVKQTAKVKKLEAEVKRGQASQQDLNEAQANLAVMENGLNKILDDFNEAANDAKQTLDNLPDTPTQAARKQQAKQQQQTRSTRGLDELEIENKELRQKLNQLETKLASETPAKAQIQQQRQQQVQQQQKSKPMPADPPSEPAGDSGEMVARAASSLLKFGLGLSGLALKMAGDVALDLRNAALQKLEATEGEAESMEMPKMDGVKARSILAANPKDLTRGELVSGTKKLTKLKTAIQGNLKAQEMMVTAKKADIAKTVDQPATAKGGGEELAEKVSTLQWLKSVQATMKAEYQAVMDKIAEMERALQDTTSSSSSSASSQQARAADEVLGGTRKKIAK